MTGLPAVCSSCGTSPDPSLAGDPPLGWSTECDPSASTGDGTQVRWMCAACTRRHVRSIEAKLDQQWW